MENIFQTPQEGFWAGEFGNEYIQRNQGNKLLASNLNFFSKSMRMTRKPKSIIEFGANIGMNLRAINLLYPEMHIEGIEINLKASEELSALIGNKNVHNCSIFDYEPTKQFDLVLIKGVLIHINPDMLGSVYEKLYLSSLQYILICEYYNPTPVTITYQGHENRLFKRDFAGEMLEKYPDLKLIDYGLSYKRDESFPIDDITWFLLSK